MIRRRPKREPYEFSQLATYNGERARGLVHTEEWQARMRAEQERFRRVSQMEQGAQYFGDWLIGTRLREKQLNSLPRKRGPRQR